MKYYYYVAVLLAAIAMLIAAFKFGSKTTTNNTTVMLPKETTIIYRDIPAQISTSPEGDTIASMDTTLTSEDEAVKVRLGIGYNVNDEKFNLKANIEQYPVKVKPKLFGFVAGVGIGFADSLRLHDAEISAGIEVKEKYSLSAFGRTDKTYGLRFGVRF
jgi:hypothetical protein